MDSNNVFKVWGKRKRILLTDRCEIDLLELKANTFCSTHDHSNKINRFYVIEGKVKIETDFGEAILTKGESWEVRPPQTHRFMPLEDSTMIEMAYVEEGIISPKDIKRYTQGGKIIDGKEITHDELRQKGMLEL